MKLQNSPTQKIVFNNKEIFLKRDDLLDVNFSGNKARKFYYFFTKEFKGVKKLISYGSNQSNAMYSMSVLAKLKGWEFDYYVDHIPSFLKLHPIGNYRYALKNGMNIVENPLKKEELKNKSYFTENSTIFIPEGGHFKEACEGVYFLAKEIDSWAKLNSIEKLNIFLPSGTGTTALYLQKYSNFKVFTTPCVGDKDYLIKEFRELEKTNHPTILTLSKKYHFGKLYTEFYKIWQELYRQTTVEFDLLYDPLGFLTMLHFYEELTKEKHKLLYIHQGGIFGNESMIPRYQRRVSNLNRK